MSALDLPQQSQLRPTIAVVGGGLAGLAAAAALSGRGFGVELFESRRMLGGRATSYRDPATGDLIDNCQHVSMRCCTNLADFCERTGIGSLLRRDRVLHFISPSGKRYDLRASSWLPAPLHLAPALLRMDYLSWRERIGILRTMHRLMCLAGAELDRTTVGEWLRSVGQSEATIERFWSVVLVSALSETVDHASLSAARKVFVDGFMATCDGYEIEVPTVPLGELYGDRLRCWLQQRGVSVRLGATIKQIQDRGREGVTLWMADGARHDFSHVIIAVPWRRLAELLAEPLHSAVPVVDTLSSIASAPITGVHLWLDRAITELPHAVLVGRLSQWLFNRSDQQRNNEEGGFHYQVVISASRELDGRSRGSVVEQVVSDLRQCFPAAKEALLLRWRMVTEQHAVFSVQPGLEMLRPSQQTDVPYLFLAGDWTRTGWPATMEGAVRSGYLAAEGLLRQIGRPEKILAPDLPRGWLVRKLIR